MISKPRLRMTIYSYGVELVSIRLLVTHNHPNFEWGEYGIDNIEHVSYLSRKGQQVFNRIQSAGRRWNDRPASLLKRFCETYRSRAWETHGDFTGSFRNFMDSHT